MPHWASPRSLAAYILASLGMCLYRRRTLSSLAVQAVPTPTSPALSLVAWMPARWVVEQSGSGLAMIAGGGDQLVEDPVLVGFVGCVVSLGDRLDKFSSGL